MSAIYEEPDSASEPVKVLITLHEGMDAMDVVGPLEVFTKAQHDMKNPDTKAFQVSFAAAQEQTTSSQGVSFHAQMTFEEAMKKLSEFDLLVIPGGGYEKITKAKAQPLALIKQFAEVQKKNPARERTLMSICTGSFFLAEAGVLSGLSATTHPDYITKLEIACANAKIRDMGELCDVVEERYVVNNLRFDLGDEDDNPYIMTRKEYREHKRRKSSLAYGTPPIEENGNGTNGTNGTRRTSAARKGSMSWKASNTRRESVLKRSNLRLGGLRVLTTSGVTSGIDGALYMVGAMVSDDAAEEVARVMCHKWSKGMVVDGTDV